MKVKAPSLLKNIIAALSNKTNELRIRIMIFFLLHKNLDKTASLSHSLHALVSHHGHHHHRKKNDDDVEEKGAYLIQNHQQQQEEEQEQGRNASLLMHYNKVANKMRSNNEQDYYTSDVEDHQHHMQTICQAHEEQPTSDLTHALFKESEAEMENESEAHGGGFEGGGGGGVAVSAVDMEEEDIDHAADLFIQRFKKQIQLQKQLSLERHQTLLQFNA